MNLTKFKENLPFQVFYYDDTFTKQLKYVNKHEKTIMEQIVSLEILSILLIFI